MTRISRNKITRRSRQQHVRLLMLSKTLIVSAASCATRWVTAISRAWLPGLQICV